MVSALADISPTLIEGGFNPRPRASEIQSTALGTRGQESNWRSIHLTDGRKDGRTDDRAPSLVGYLYPYPPWQEEQTLRAVWALSFFSFRVERGAQRSKRQVQRERATQLIQWWRALEGGLFNAGESKQTLVGVASH